MFIVYLIGYLLLWVGLSALGIGAYRLIERGIEASHGQHACRTGN